ncbi:MAG: tryptophan-rich sensory protein [Bacteroidales bacterium]|nr:tryptophan-rich sensory protein [Bacteroidales bacterium]
MKIVNVFLYALMLVMNYLANALPLNNRTTGELSGSFPNLFVPAGLTFSIWGVIYLLLLAYCVMQFTGPDQEDVSGISLLFGISCLLNSLWIVSWHYEKLPLSLLVMIGLLVTLIMINRYIATMPQGLIKAAFGIYLGWICIATIANVTALLVNYNFSLSGISEEAWTIIMIAAGMLITGWAMYILRNPFIGLSVIWAFIGIAIKRQADHRSIFIAAVVALSLVALLTLWGFIRKSTTA